MCAVHFVFVMLAVTSLTFGSRIQTVVAHIISVLVSILLLCKMIYQIENIKHDTWIVNCTVSSSTLLYTRKRLTYILHTKSAVSGLALGIFIHKTPLSTFKLGLLSHLWTKCRVSQNNHDFSK